MVNERFDRRAFLRYSAAFLTSVVLNSCGNDSTEKITPEPTSRINQNNLSSLATLEAMYKDKFTESSKRIIEESKLAPPPRTCFEWPATGPISSYATLSPPLGIDIDGYRNPIQEINATGNGKVVFSGGETCCRYGEYVVLEHEDGVFSLYAHLSKLEINTDTYVKTGQKLGKMGKTGYATGNHLHFKLRRLKNLVDLPILSSRFSDSKFWQDPYGDESFYFYNPITYLRDGNNLLCPPLNR